VSVIWGRPLKCLQWMVVILGISLVSLAPIIPRVDLPETVYDETDTPVNLATPVAVGTNLTKPREKLPANREEKRGWWEPHIATHEAAPKLGMRDSHSVLSLLCKFLC
jgi:hypothetical protein